CTQRLGDQRGTEKFAVPCQSEQPWLAALDGLNERGKQRQIEQHQHEPDENPCRPGTHEWNSVTQAPLHSRIFPRKARISKLRHQPTIGTSRRTTARLDSAAARG